MSDYIYDEYGNRYRKEKDDELLGGWGLFIFLALAVLIAFAPGMVISSLFASFIDTSLWAWIWTGVFSVGFFFLVYWFYWAIIKKLNPWKWTIGTYVILSVLSIVLLFASEADNIVRISKLLKFWM